MIAGIFSDVRIEGVMTGSWRRPANGSPVWSAWLVILLRTVLTCSRLGAGVGIVAP